MNTLTEIFGEPAAGKTHSAHAGWPDPLHIDTAMVQMGFREFHTDTGGAHGESWPVVCKQYDWDTDTANEHYEYATAFSDALQAVRETDKRSIVIDNTTDLRALAAMAWCDEHDQDWPQQSQWGEVNQMVDNIIQEATNNHHVVLISQMKDEYVNGQETGERVWDGPKRIPYRCDFRVRVAIEDGDRHTHIEKNRFLDKAGDGWVDDLGGSIELEELCLVSDIPESEWELHQ